MGQINFDKFTIFVMVDGTYILDVLSSVCVLQTLYSVHIYVVYISCAHCIVLDVHLVYLCIRHGLYSAHCYSYLVFFNFHVIKHSGSYWNNHVFDLLF